MFRDTRSFSLSFRHCLGAIAEVLKLLGHDFFTVNWGLDIEAPEPSHMGDTIEREVSCDLYEICGGTITVSYHRFWDTVEMDVYIGCDYEVADEFAYSGYSEAHMSILSGRARVEDGEVSLEDIRIDHSILEQSIEDIEWLRSHIDIDTFMGWVTFQYREGRATIGGKTITVVSYKEWDM